MMFSIVTIVRNDPLGLQRTRESISSQSNLNYEWIIIDGASTDATVKILNEVALNKEAIHLVSEPDAGIYDAMNKGLLRCKCDYVVFMNAGDVFYDSNSLKRISESIDDDYAIVYGDWINVVDGVDFYCRARSSFFIFYGMICSHQSLIYKTDVLSGYAYDLSYRVSGDYAITSKVLRDFKKIRKLDFPLAKFYAGGISDSLEAIGRSENRRVQTEILGLPSLVVYMIQSAYWGLAFLRRRAAFLYVYIRKFSRLV